MREAFADAALDVVECQRARPVAISIADGSVERDVLISDVLQVIMLHERPAKTAPDGAHQVTQQPVVSELHGDLVEIGGRTSRRQTVADACALLLVFQGNPQQFKPVASVAFRGKAKHHRLEHLPDLVEVREISVGEFAHDGPGARTQLDQAFAVEHLQCVAHRHSADAELSGKIPLDELAARLAGTIEDGVTQPGRDSTGFQFVYSAHKAILA